MLPSRNISSTIEHILYKELRHVDGNNEDSAKQSQCKADSNLQ